MTKEELLEEYKDLILSLRDCSKPESKSFRDAWRAKCRKVADASAALQEDDWEWLESEYQKVYKEHILPLKP